MARDRAEKIGAQWGLHNLLRIFGEDLGVDIGRGGLTREEGRDHRADIGPKIKWRLALRDGTYSISALDI